MEHRIDLVVVDYLQLMRGDTRNDNRVQEVSYISRNLKVLARELNVPVLAAAQLSRAVEQIDQPKNIRRRQQPAAIDVLAIHEKGLVQQADLIEYAFSQ